jgi:endonuclease-3
MAGTGSGSGRAARRPGREARAARHERAARLLAALESLYPDAGCALEHRTPLELLVATILSAQCTDARVNLVTPELFHRYRSAGDYAAADRAELEQQVRSTGFYRNKARSIQGMAAALCARHGGQVPESMAELVELPGVARKTANVVLGTAFGRNEGVVVDTHIHRLAHRLGLSRERDPNRVERDLMALFPRPRWTFLGHALIWHGRRVCAARKPRCGDCALRADCPSAGRA